MESRVQIQWMKVKENLDQAREIFYPECMPLAGKVINKPFVTRRSKPWLAKTPPVREKSSAIKDQQLEMEKNKNVRTGPPKIARPEKDQEIPKQNSLKHKRGASLKELRPEDKRRVANLIQELAKAGEERELALKQLQNERSEFQDKIEKIRLDQEKLIAERDALKGEILEYQLRGQQETMAKGNQEKLAKSRLVSIPDLTEMKSGLNHSEAIKQKGAEKSVGQPIAPEHVAGNERWLVSENSDSSGQQNKIYYFVGNIEQGLPAQPFQPLPSGTSSFLSTDNSIRSGNVDGDIAAKGQLDCSRQSSSLAHRSGEKAAGTIDQLMKAQFAQMPSEIQLQSLVSQLPPEIQVQFLTQQSKIQEQQLKIQEQIHKLQQIQLNFLQNSQHTLTGSKANSKNREETEAIHGKISVLSENGASTTVYRNTETPGPSNDKPDITSSDSISSATTLGMAHPENGQQNLPLSTPHVSCTKEEKEFSDVRVGDTAKEEAKGSEGLKQSGNIQTMEDSAQTQQKDIFPDEEDNEETGIVHSAINLERKKPRSLSADHGPENFMTSSLMENVTKTSMNHRSIPNTSHGSLKHFSRPRQNVGFGNIHQHSIRSKREKTISESYSEFGSEGRMKKQHIREKNQSVFASSSDTTSKKECPSSSFSFIDSRSLQPRTSTRLDKILDLLSNIEDKEAVDEEEELRRTPQEQMETKREKTVDEFCTDDSQETTILEEIFFLQTSSHW